ncbi:MAG: hypothetical protein ACTSRW_06895 [Candidatus Helarchaeota archaeon]
MAVNTELPKFEDIWTPIHPTDEYNSLKEEWEEAQNWVRDLIAKCEKKCLKNSDIQAS